MRWHPHGLYIPMKSESSVSVTSKDGKTNKKQEQRRENVSKIRSEIKGRLLLLCIWMSSFLVAKVLKIYLCN